MVYLCALPFLLFAGLGAVLFFLATAYLLGREYFEMAAMRFHPVAEAKALRRLNRGTVFVAGMFIAAFVSIPIVNLATPVFGMAFMVHMYKRMAGGPKRELWSRRRARASRRNRKLYLPFHHACTRRDPLGERKLRRVFSGHLHSSLIRQRSHFGVRATQM